LTLDGDFGRRRDRRVPADTATCEAHDLDEPISSKYLSTTHGWFDSPPVRETFERFLAPYRGTECRVLEVGCWEGVSACSFLDLLGPEARITCVDPFTGSKEHDDPIHLERFFDDNVRRGGHTERVRKIKARSAVGLPLLVTEGATFDVIYIDGSHIARDVLFDAVLAAELVRENGLVMFDDYLWTDLPDPLDRPKPAIDAFVTLYRREFDVLHQDWRVFLRKKPGL
jgi:predicted O-methyltransferase YrrM